MRMAAPMLTLALFAVATAGCREDRPAKPASSAASDQAKDAVAEIRDEVRRAEEESASTWSEPPARPGVCDGVSESEIAAVEDKMSRMQSELVVLTADDQRALDCSRSRR